MPVFRIACLWQIATHAMVEADSMEEAIAKVESPSYPLPEADAHSDYVDGTFTVDRDGCEESKTAVRWMGIP